MQTVFLWIIRIGAVLGFLLLAITLVYFGWKAERWINWKLGYQDAAAAQAQSEIEPLKKEMQELRERIEKLEAKSHANHD